MNEVKTDNLMLTAQEVAQMLGCKPGMGYKIIRQLNQELAAKGKITLHGKINRQFFLQKVNVE